jgi:hypothetical protein
MPTQRLTAQTIQSLKPQAQRVDYFDSTTPGFGLRVTPSGIKTWFFLYRINGRRLRRWTIGRYPTLSLAQARDKAKIAAGDLAKEGIDPAATKTLPACEKARAMACSSRTATKGWPTAQQ